MSQIVQAFHRTDFAKPTTGFQPAGLRTFVNLENFYRVDWPAAGYQPDEIDHIDPARMLGYRVDIRPVFVNASYEMGDGTTLGPIASLGGVHPTGDIRHVYSKPGQYPLRTHVTYTGQFRIDGGDWIDIPDQVTITGPTATLDVDEAVARLVP